MDDRSGVLVHGGHRRLLVRLGSCDARPLRRPRSAGEPHPPRRRARRPGPRPGQRRGGSRRARAATAAAATTGTSPPIRVGLRRRAARSGRRASGAPGLTSAAAVASRGHRGTADGDRGSLQDLRGPVLEDDRELMAFPRLRPAVGDRDPARDGGLASVRAIGVLGGALLAALVGPDDGMGRGVLRLHEGSLPGTGVPGHARQDDDARTHEQHAQRREPGQGGTPQAVIRAIHGGRGRQPDAEARGRAAAVRLDRRGASRTRCHPGPRRAGS